MHRINDQHPVVHQNMADVVAQNSDNHNDFQLSEVDFWYLWKKGEMPAVCALCQFSSTSFIYQSLRSPWNLQNQKISSSNVNNQAWRCNLGIHMPSCLQEGHRQHRVGHTE